MPTMHIRTFLQNASLDSGTAFNKLKAYTQKGGHNYYWSLQKGAQGMINQGMTYDQAAGIAGSITRNDERVCNQSSLRTFYGGD